MRKKKDRRSDLLVSVAACRADLRHEFSRAGRLAAYNYYAMVEEMKPDLWRRFFVAIRRFKSA